MKRKGGILDNFQREYARLLRNFNKLLETIKAETIEKLKAQEELTYLQEYSHHIIESAAEGIIACDLDWRLTSFSPAAEKLLSYRSEEIHGRYVKDFFEKPEEFARLKNLIAKGGQVKNFDATLVNKEGVIIPVMLSFSDLKGPKGKPMGLVGVIRDLREIRELQTQLIQAGKLAALGQLAAGVAHEINNPLAIVSGHIQLLLAETKEPKIKSTLESIDSEIGRCQDITQGLLSFTGKSTSQEFELLDLNECIKTSFFFLKQKFALSNIKIVMRLGRSLPKIKGNFNQLQQVFINLFLNALDAMPKGGSLYIKTGTLNKKFVQTVIADTGAGIAPQDLPHIFEPFYTTKEPGRGIGLGLSISYGIIKGHAGEIEAQRRINKADKKGKTIFTIKIPLAQKRP